MSHHPMCVSKRVCDDGDTYWRHHLETPVVVEDKCSTPCLNVPQALQHVEGGDGAVPKRDRLSSGHTSLVFIASSPSFESKPDWTAELPDLEDL